MPITLPGLCRAWHLVVERDVDAPWKVRKDHRGHKMSVSELGSNLLQQQLLLLLLSDSRSHIERLVITLEGRKIKGFFNELGVVLPTCSLIVLEAYAGDYKFRASLGYVLRKTHPNKEKSLSGRWCSCGVCLMVRTVSLC